MLLLSLFSSLLFLVVGADDIGGGDVIFIYLFILFIFFYSLIN